MQSGESVVFRRCAPRSRPRAGRARGTDMTPTSRVCPRGTAMADSGLEQGQHLPCGTRSNVRDTQGRTSDALDSGAILRLAAGDQIPLPLESGGGGGGAIPVGRSPPPLPRFVPGGKTSGEFQTPAMSVPLRSGYEGPAASVPKGTPGFDIITRAHIEGHAAALMRNQKITHGTLYINNPTICDSCAKLLPRMLPPGSTLDVVLPNGAKVPFKGIP
jgi:hypothetical protein